MEIKELLKQFKQSTTQQTLNKIHEKTIGSALLQIGTAVPGLLHSLTLTGEKFIEETTNARLIDERTIRIFTAQGPRAQRLREHAFFLDYALQDSPEPHAKAQVRMEALLKSFLFHPLQGRLYVEPIIKLLDTLTEMAKLKDVFPKNLENFHDVTQGDSTKAPTGLYLDREGKPVIIIRTKVMGQGDMELLAVATPSQFTPLFYYHPGEDFWCQADAEVTFLGVEETLDAEIEKIVHQLGLKNDLDFIDEVDQLLAALKPTLIQNRLDKVKTPYYRRDTPVSSQVRIPTQFGTITFWNTQGAYPSQRWSFTRDEANMRSVAFSQYPAPVLSYIVGEVSRIVRQLIQP